MMRPIHPLQLCLTLFLLGAATAIAHPVPESPLWLTYAGKDGPGKGKHIVLMAADQEYRSEQSLPMLARILSEQHGFDCTVLFSVNENGEADPTLKIRWEQKDVEHNIPGLEHLGDLEEYENRDKDEQEED